MGTRNFILESNLPNVSTKQVHEGKSFGLLLGSDVVLLKATYGAYHSSDGESQALKQSEIGGGINFYPLKLMSAKMKYFSPYVIVHNTKSTIRLSGTYTPEVEKSTAPAKDKDACTCPCCQASSAMADDPDKKMMVEEKPAESLPFNGKVSTSRIAVGAGLQCNLRKNNLFLRLFAEAKYGMGIGSKSSVVALEKTKVANQMGIDFGVSFGLTGQKR